MQLEEFFDYKNRLMEDLLTSETIVHLIDSNISVEDAGQLVYKKVFPYENVPDTIEHGDCYVCVDVDIQGRQQSGGTFLSPVIYVWVFTHKSKLHLNEGGVHTDKLCSEISKRINGSYFYGMGELELYSVKRFAPVTDYQGKVMTFHTTDWNRPNLGASTKRPIPSNRKQGK